LISFRREGRRDMDQDLSQWLHEHQLEIQQRWWAVARETDLVSSVSLDQLAKEDAFGPGSFRQRVLASLASDAPPDRDWIDSLIQGLQQRELLALQSALRRALFDYVALESKSQCVPERWRMLERASDRLDLAIADAFDTRLASLNTEREHWHTLYSLTRELTASIDLSYVLQNAIVRILDAVDADRGAVMLLDSRTESVVPQAAQDWQDVHLRLADLPLDWQRGHGEPQILNAGDADVGIFEPLIRDEHETIIVAPLLANGQFYGTLVIAAADTEGFDPQQLELIDAVANNLASSIGSSDVIQTLSDQARELGMMLRQQQDESSKREAILASIADGVVFNDQRGRIVLVNRAAELILDTEAEGLIGRDLHDLLKVFTVGAREDLVKAMEIVLENPTLELAPEVAQTILQIDNRIINAHLASVITEGGESLGVVTVFRDITKEVEADRAKTEFVSTVSHELRTPMTAIKGYTDLIHSGAVGEINENQKRFLGIIKTNTDRLTAMVNDLLDISRVETGRVRFEPAPVQLGDIIKTVIDALAPNAENKRHKLTFHVRAGLPEIMGDSDRLTQVFTNLIGNAINYTPEGGELSVDVYSVENAVRADVRDTGIGIPAEDLGKIFERFYRADHPLVQESRGTGLGLPIVKLFVEMHGGRVWAESIVGQGSTFTVLLPMPTDERESVIKPISPETVITLQKRHVLVADDDPDIAGLIKLHLEETGFRVTVVGRGAKVLELAHRDCPDLIVLDILLPDMDGRAVLEALKAETPTADIPVLMLTVIVDDGTAFDLGAAGYLNKPIEAEELREAVQAALSRRGRILVVEDDVDTIEMMRIALRRVGYNVDVASDGYEALTLARRWRPQAIVLDLRMPGMDGYEALTHLKRNLNTQDIPILVVSAHVADWEKESKRLKGMGVVSCIPKPFTVSQLVTEIDGALGKVSIAEDGNDGASSG
jgi:PAS domain S-box-containing protein